MGSREELEKLVFFESAREQAEADHKANPKDAHALSRWGAALLELAHFRQGTDSIDLIEQAVKRLEMAIALNPKKHDALWCLGNAYTSQGFMYADVARAAHFFEQARVVFQRALDEEPRNETYKKALEMTQKAPYLHQELQKQLLQQQQQQQMQQQMQMGGGGGGGGESSTAAAQSDFWYDMGGWAMLAGLMTAWVFMARVSSK